ncbi:MAG: hypothetical protein JWN08_3774, partial [Frankiales bacterium]|nr:hypothetical protein [Frankiales bacterium]
EDVAAPLLLLKRLHLYRGRLVVMNIALICDNNRVGFRRWLWSQLLRGASAVVSHTRVHADAVPTTFEVEPERSHFMHFAVDETWFASFPWAPSHLAPQVVAAGHAGRDYELLIDAAAIMPDVQFVILSSQDNIDRLRATRSDPPGNVLIRLGDLSHRELAGCIASCDVAVLPLVESQVSTGQTVLLELMAMGVATVVSDVSGVADYITAGVRTVPPGDLGALVAAVRRLLDQPDEASALGECAKDQVRRFTAQRTWPRMSELLFPERDPAGRPPALLDADATSVSPAAEPR